MKKKTNYLIAALIFIILALAWQLYIRTQPTKEEIKKIEEQSESIPEPKGIKVFKGSTSYHTTEILIGLSSVHSYNNSIDATFTLPNGTIINEDLEIGSGFAFWSKNGESYEIRLLHVNTEYKKEYAIFDIRQGNSLKHPYYEQKKHEQEQTNLQQQSVEISDELLKPLEVTEEDEIEGNIKK